MKCYTEKEMLEKSETVNKMCSKLHIFHNDALQF